MILLRITIFGHAQLYHGNSWKMALKSHYCTPQTIWCCVVAKPLYKIHDVDMRSPQHSSWKYCVLKTGTLNCMAPDNGSWVSLQTSLNKQLSSTFWPTVLVIFRAKVTKLTSAMKTTRSKRHQQNLFLFRLSLVYREPNPNFHHCVSICCSVYLHLKHRQPSSCYNIIRRFFYNYIVSLHIIISSRDTDSNSSYFSLLCGCYCR